jgi:ribose transport system substrate-binding protein
MISRRRFAALTAGAGLASLVPWTSARAAGHSSGIIGFAQDHMANDWRAAQVASVARALAAAAPGVRFLHTDARGSSAQQVLDIDSLLTAGIDVLITSPRDAAVVTPAVSRAHRAGVKVVLLTRRVMGDDYATFIGPDDAAIALNAARVLAASLHGQGRILVLQGVPRASTTIARTAGFLEELANFPGLSVAATLPASFLRADAIRAVESALADKLAFDAIFAQSDSMATGARMALRKAGLDPATIPIVGIDYIPEAREAIRRGEQVASFTYPTCGAEGADAALRLLRGEPVEREVVVPSVLVTRHNVDIVEPVL